MIQTLSGSKIVAPDPIAVRLDFQQPNARLRQFQRTLIDEMTAFFQPEDRRDAKDIRSNSGLILICSTRLRAHFFSAYEPKRYGIARISWTREVAIGHSPKGRA